MGVFPDVPEAGPSAGDVQHHMLCVAGLACIGGDSMPLPTGLALPLTLHWHR